MNKAELRKAILKCHPDKSPDDPEAEEKVKALIEEYESSIEMVENVKRVDIIREEREVERKEAQERFKARKAEAREKGQIDNADLYAGSPMYYYCRHCGLLSDVLPESWWIQGPRCWCDACWEDREILGLKE